MKTITPCNSYLGRVELNAPCKLQFKISIILEVTSVRELNYVADRKNSAVKNLKATIASAFNKFNSPQCLIYYSPLVYETSSFDQSITHETTPFSRDLIRFGFFVPGALPIVVPIALVAAPVELFKAIVPDSFQPGYIIYHIKFHIEEINAPDGQ